VHEKVHDELVGKLVEAYKQVNIGDPLKEGTLCGPVHSKNSVRDYENGLKTIVEQVRSMDIVSVLLIG
jgi:aldehyde dehydrogenase family 7 protein A1